MKLMVNEVKKLEYNRPYWHVDAKWITSIFFMFIFGLSLFTYGLFILTNEKNGIDTMTKMITLSFSRDGVDSTKDIDQFMQKIEISPDKTIKPIPALNITITKSEIEGKTPREIRYAIFRKIATPIYFNGKGAEEVLNTPEAKANFEKDTTLLRIFSENSHNLIGKGLIGMGAFSGMLLGLVVFFSYRFGRIANPGFIVFMTAGPWALIFTVLSLVSKNFSDQAISFGENGDYGAMIGPFVRETMPNVAGIFANIYSTAFFVGLGLIVLAGISKLVVIKIRKG